MCNSVYIHTKINYKMAFFANLSTMKIIYYESSHIYSIYMVCNRIYTDTQEHTRTQTNIGTDRHIHVHVHVDTSYIL